MVFRTQNWIEFGLGFVVFLVCLCFGGIFGWVLFGGACCGLVFFFSLKGFFSLFLGEEIVLESQSITFLNLG